MKFKSEVEEELVKAYKALRDIGIDVSVPQFNLENQPIMTMGHMVPHSIIQWVVVTWRASIPRELIDFE